MKGLELSKRYYEEFGKQMIEEEFSDISRFLAVGLVGGGSECLGFDDEISEDHDFEPGFCIFLPGEDIVDRKEAFRLERAYAKLPKDFMGYSRNMMSPVGGSRHGVIRTADFYKEKAGLSGEDISMEDWFIIPSYALREATDGEVFVDHYGEFSRIREKLSFMPEDVRLKKLAGHLLLMAQAGQYNYPRIVKRGEKEAAQLAVYEFVKSTLEVIFLLNREYMPYYKWSFRALKSLDRLSELDEAMYYIMTTTNDDIFAEDKYDIMEQISSEVIEELKTQKITEAVCQDLEKHAYSVNDMITDGDIRNKNILYAV